MDTVARKFEVPRLPALHISRERLLVAVGRGLAADRRITVVRSGPGTGKSLLLADYVRRSDALTAWYRLTGSDRDPLVFAAHLFGALGRRLPSLSNRPGQIVAARGAAGFATALGLLCDELADRLDGPLVLVLDDCHHLPESPEVAAALEEFVAFFPEASQVVFSGRGVPVPGLEGCQARGELVAIEDGDLAFTPAEVSDLLEREWGSSVSPDLARRIAEQTRGWAIAVSHAVRLSREAPGPEPRARQPDELIAYLAREVLQGLDATFVRQLSSCAYLPQVGPRECSVLFGQEGSGFLAALGRLGTFAAQVGDGYEFHPLFSEVLVREFREAFDARERRAVLGRMVELAGSPAERVRFLLLAEEWAAAGSELANALPALLAEGRLVTVRDLLDAFPEALRGVSAALRYAEGCLLVREGRTAQGVAILREAERLAGSEERVDLLGRIWAALADASIRLGEPEQQAHCASQALAVLPPDAAPLRALCHNASGMNHLQRRDVGAAVADFEAALGLCRRAGDVAGEVRALHNLGFAASCRGDHPEAIERYRDAIERARLAGILPLPLTYANLAVSSISLGRPADCWSAIEAGMGLAEELGGARDRSYLLWAAGVLAFRQGDLRRAWNLLLEALAAAEECGDRSARAQAHLGLAEIALQRGMLDLAREEVGHGLASAGLALEAPEMVGAATLLADLHLRQGDTARAGSLLDHASRCFDRNPNPYHECWTERLWAAWHRLRGDQEGERAHLRRMRDLAERHGYPVPAEWPAPLPPVDSRSAASLQLRCFEPFEVVVFRRAVGSREWLSANAKVLLACLALNPEGMSRQDLVELLYPEQEVSRSAVSNVICRLREALEPACRQGAPSRFILAAGGRYRLNPGTPVWCDAVEFLHLIDQAKSAELAGGERRDLLQRAVGLYRGAFLAGFQELPWVREQVTRLRGMALKACDELLQLAAAADDWPALESHAEGALRIEPCHHAAARCKVVALVMQERFDEALRFGTAAGKRVSDCVPADDDLPGLLRLIRQERVTVRSLRTFLPSPP